MGRTLGLIFLVLVVLAMPVFAQQTVEADTEPQEYGEDEFSPFLRNLRRAEIVMFGSFPLTLFLTLEVFDIYRLIENRGTPDSYKYVFWPYRSSDPAPYSSGEIAGILVTALSTSLLIAVADFIIGSVKEKRSER